MQRENYINIQGWMITDLHLSGNELILYALIYGFSQDGVSEFYGSLSYIEKFLNISRPTAIALLKKLMYKNVIENTTESHYKVVKKLYHPSKETLPVASKETLPNIYKTNNNSNADFFSKNQHATSDSLLKTEELVYEPLEGAKTKGAFLDRARAKKGKPPMLKKDPTTWNIINKYRIQYKYIRGIDPIIGDADYFHVLSITKKLSTEEMEAMIIWYVKEENKKFKEHPSLKSIFTIENVNLFKAQK